MAMKSQTFMIKKADSNHTCLAVISLDSALKKDDNYYPQVLLNSIVSLDSVLQKDKDYYPPVFLTACKYTEKKVIRYISVNLSDFSSSLFLLSFFLLFFFLFHCFNVRNKKTASQIFLSPRK